MNPLLGQPPSLPPPPHPPNSALTPKWAKNLTWIVATFYVALAIMTGFYTKTNDIQWWALVIVAAFCHFVLASVKIIREQEMAILIFFGIILEEWKSGPHFALWPFFYVRRETKNAVQVDFGTLDEKKVQEIERARRSESSKSWYVMTEPVRINWGDIRSSLDLAPGHLSPAEKAAYIKEQLDRYANDPYANTLTTDPHFYFRIKIANLKNLIEEVGGLEEAMERIKVTCVRALQEEAGKTFVAKARQELKNLSQLILARVEDLVADPNPNDPNRSRSVLRNSWGLDVEEAAIQDIGAPHATNTALAERAATIATADGTAIATIRTSESNRIRVINEGEAKAVATIANASAEEIRLSKEGAGQAAAISALATAEQTRLALEGEGRAAALKAVGESATSTGGELVLKVDALRAVMTASGGKIVVVPSDLSALTGAIMGATEALKPPSPPPQS